MRHPSLKIKYRKKSGFINECLIIVVGQWYR